MDCTINTLEAAQTESSLENTRWRHTTVMALNHVLQQSCVFWWRAYLQKYQHVEAPFHLIAQPWGIKKEPIISNPSHHFSPVRCKSVVHTHPDFLASLKFSHEICIGEGYFKMSKVGGGVNLFVCILELCLFLFWQLTNLMMTLRRMFANCGVFTFTLTERASLWQTH